jgi:hypothetical protein
MRPEKERKTSDKPEPILSTLISVIEVIPVFLPFSQSSWLNFGNFLELGT